MKYDALTLRNEIEKMYPNDSSILSNDIHIVINSFISMFYSPFGLDTLKYSLFLESPRTIHDFSTISNAGV